MIESGSCGGGLISTVSECDAAGTALDLNSGAGDYSSITYPNLPPGCTFFSYGGSINSPIGSLYVHGGGSTGSCSSSRQCICKSTSP